MVIDIVPSVATVQADPTINIAAVERVPEIPADTWVQGIQKMCQALIESTNQTIARWHEFKEMPRGEWTFEKWGIKFKKLPSQTDWKNMMRKKQPWKQARKNIFSFSQPRFGPKIFSEI